MVHSKNTTITRCESNVDRYLVGRNELQEQRDQIEQELAAVTKLYKRKILSEEQYDSCKKAILFKACKKDILIQMNSLSNKYHAGIISFDYYNQCQLKIISQSEGIICKGHVKQIVENINFELTPKKEPGEHSNVSTTPRRGIRRVMSTRIANLKARFENVS